MKKKDDHDSTKQIEDIDPEGDTTNCAENQSDDLANEKVHVEKARKTAREKFRECFYCHNSISGPIKLCSGCKKVCYCNRDCQKAHWKIHRQSCTYKELTG